MNEIKNLRSRLSEQEGQTMAEYAVVLAVITVLIIASLTLSRAPSRALWTPSLRSCRSTRHALFSSEGPAPAGPPRPGPADVLPSAGCGLPLMADLGDVPP